MCKLIHYKNYNPSRLFLTACCFTIISRAFCLSIQDLNININPKALQSLLQIAPIAQNMNAFLMDKLQEVDKDPKKPNGKFYAFDAKSKPIWKPYVQADLKDIKDPKVAILIHGLLGSKMDMSNLAKFISEELINSKTKKPIYNVVLAYNYNCYPGIEAISKQFSSDYNQIRNNFKSADIYTHSLGGLVGRWKIEKGTPDDSVKRLITFGTPHSGIPYSIFDNIQIDYQTVKDMESSIQSKQIVEKSDFLKNLNEGNSPLKDKVDYYTIAGNQPNSTFLFGSMIDSKYKSLLGNNALSDGLVATQSANPDLLGRKSSKWAANANMRKIVSNGHFDLIGTDTLLSASNKQPVLPQSVKSILLEWAKDWID